MRRFLLHSLPDGFHCIRQYGFLANGCRRARLATIRQLLPVTKGEFGEPTDDAPLIARLQRFDPTVCPCCGAPCRSPRHYCAGERRPFDCGLIRHEQEPRSQHYPSSVAASHPIDGMVALCPSTVTPRGRQVAPGIVPDWSAGIHRNIARKKPRASVAHGAHAPARIERNGTNPIVRSRVSRSVQSGFNEVTHSVRPDPQRRATSQKPPDSQGLVFLIQGRLKKQGFPDWLKSDSWL